ncbi:UPAR/Ly6 domain-containing protein crok [Lycorma delicatula]|uniref:UPAR/Ly6 domain-containing protein crok n=1 Tax=Lycorma delicatula TaxID=130591 RepID=UPI003F5123ED
MHYIFIFTAFLIVIFTHIPEGIAIQCYQCSSAEDGKGEDNCGAYDKFHKERHIAVECSSDESVTPGTFCMKLTQQGPRGFIWDGRWRQVIRRCASVAETGVTGVCNWGVMDNGIYWEECYCSEDGCNSSNVFSYSPLLYLALIFVSVYQCFYNF